ncbi:MAG: TIGR02206 family membrane protein [Flavobacteriia bacterium]|nr:TIGR02206 family membrane protein [Flavobacteriia bacterium]
MDHYIVEIGSLDWLYGWLVVLILGVFALRIIPKIQSLNPRHFEIAWGAILFLMMGIEHFEMIRAGVWDLQYSLPLQMCSLSGFLLIFTLWFRNKWTYLFVLFWGVSGGLHSFLTPEHTLGGEPLFFWSYNLWHASIIIGPLYFFFIQKWGIPKRSFLKVFGYTHVVWIAVGLIDWEIGANYMYVLEPPAAENPFVVGKFPYHLIGFEIAGIIHFGLTAVIFSWIQKRRSINAGIWAST